MIDLDELAVQVGRELFQAAGRATLAKSRETE